MDTPPITNVKMNTATITNITIIVNMQANAYMHSKYVHKQKYRQIDKSSSRFADYMPDPVLHGKPPTPTPAGT